MKPTDTQPAVFSVLGHRGFRHLWLAQIFSQLSINMMLFLLALVVYRHTASNVAVSGLYLAYGIPAVLFGMVAGVVVDKLDRRKVLMSCDFIRAILVAGLFFLSRNIAVVYVLVFFNSLVTQFYVPAEAPSIPRLVPAQSLVTANSLFSFTYYSSMALGFILAGPLLRLLGTRTAFLLLSGFFLFASWSVSHIPPQAEAEGGYARFFRYDITDAFRLVFRNLREGISYVTTSLDLFDALLLLTGTQVTLAMLGTLGPGFADRVMGIDIRDASLVIIGPVVVGILLGAMWVGNIGFRIKTQKLISTGILSAGIILMLVSLTVYLSRTAATAWFFQPRIIFPLEIILFFCLGVANSLLDVPANSILQREAQGDMRGRVYGMLTTAVGGVGILPVITGGVLADAIGVGKVIFLLGGGIVAYGFYRIRYGKKRGERLQ